jgi:glutamine amidotransferase
MCRWFAYVSPTEPCLLEDVLITPQHSLSKQVHDHYLPKLFSHVPGEQTSKQEITLRNRLNNVDGFGMVWYTPSRSGFITDLEGSRPVVYKNAQPPNNDANFHSICAGTATKGLFAHIRAATGTSVAAINNHPFTFGRHTIMHNGLVSHFTDIRRPMLNLIEKSAYENIHGTTDSEHLAALYITNLTKNVGGGTASWERQYPPNEMLEALITSFHQIISLQQSTLGAQNVQACSLNVCCTDGQQLISVRLRNHAVENPPSLYYSTTAGVTLNSKYPDHPDAGVDNPNPSKSAAEHGKHVIVASEPSTYKIEEWKVIEKNHAVLVDREGNCTELKVDMPKEFLASAATGKHF